MKTFEDFGGMVLANACGPCIGKSPFLSRPPPVPVTNAVI